MSAHVLDVIGASLITGALGFVGGAYYIVRTRMGGAR